MASFRWRSLTPYLVIFLATVLCTYGSDDQSVTISNDRDCLTPKIRNQSGHFPVVPSGGSVHMFCEVKYPDSSSAFNATANYKRFPPRLHSAPSPNLTLNYHATGTVLKVYLTIMNLTWDDAADYSLTVGECSFVCANISLHVDECIGVQPKPVAQQNISVTAPQTATSLTLTANFTGATDELTYPIILSSESINDLVLHDSNKYSYKSQKYPNCVLSVVFVIHNLSVEDTGLYRAQARGHRYSSPQVFFHVKVVDPGTEENLLRLIWILAVVVCLLPVALCATVYVSQRKKHPFTHHMLISGGNYQELPLPRHLQTSQSDDPSRPLIHVQRNLLCTQPASKVHSSVFILYCRGGIATHDLEDLLEVLELCGIRPHIDLNVQETHGQFPENWTRWMQEELETCAHVLVICSSQLLEAFAHANDAQMGYVEMCKGQFHAKSILNCIQPSKTVLLFVNCSKDPRIIPLPQLWDRKSFELNLTDLLEVSEDDETQLENAIQYNDSFGDFKDLVQHLQY